MATVTFPRCALPGARSDTGLSGALGHGLFPLDHFFRVIGAAVPTAAPATASRQEQGEQRAMRIRGGGASKVRLALN